LEKALHLQKETMGGAKKNDDLGEELPRSSSLELSGSHRTF